MHIETRYVHLTYEKHGISKGDTCGTAGYSSILTRNECMEAARTMQMIPEYHVGPNDPRCVDTNPNHCFTKTWSKGIFFTDADCPESQGRVNLVANSDNEVGLICLKQGII